MKSPQAGEAILSKHHGTELSWIYETGSSPGKVGQSWGTSLFAGSLEVLRVLVPRNHGELGSGALSSQD